MYKGRLRNDAPKREANFLALAHKKHGTSFDYSEMIYQNSFTPIRITCAEHGAFMQTPNSHLQSKHGCPDCARESKSTIPLQHPSHRGNARAMPVVAPRLRHLAAKLSQQAELRHYRLALETLKTLIREFPPEEQ